MFINDLGVKTIITINATMKNKSVRLESEVAEITSEDKEYLELLGLHDYCVINVIKEGDKPLSFLSDKVEISVTASIENKPYTWLGVKILKLKLPSRGVSHIILSSENAETYNRRNEYRQWFGYDATCKIGDSKVPHLVLLKDMSPSGLGLLCDASLKMKVGETVEIQFHEQSDKGSKLFTVEAIIVRFIPMNNNRMLVGCKLKVSSRDLDKLIYSKQGKNKATKRDIYLRDSEFVKEFSKVMKDEG